MAPLLKHLLFLLFIVSCLSLIEGGKRRHKKKTHKVNHKNKWWKVDTVGGGADLIGEDYQSKNIGKKGKGSLKIENIRGSVLIWSIRRSALNF